MWEKLAPPMGPGVISRLLGFTLTSTFNTSNSTSTSPLSGLKSGLREKIFVSHHFRRVVFDTGEISAPPMKLDEKR